MSETRSVVVGERDVTIRPFNGRKAKLVTRAVKALSRQVPDLSDRAATWQRKYEKDHATEVTRDEVLAFPYWRERLGHVTDEEWAERGGQITLPAEPPGWQVILHMLPELLDVAEDEVLRLLALCSVANSDLAAANRDGDDAVDTFLKVEADRLLDEGSVGQLVALAQAAREVIEAELAPYADPMRSLARTIQQARQGTPPPRTEEDPEEPEPDVIEGTEAPTTSTEAKPPSSTGSRPRTGGTRGRRSTAPAGAGSSSSAP